MPKFDREDLSELGEAYRTNLDVELRPTGIEKEIGWLADLSTFQARNSLARRFLRLGAIDRAGIVLIPIAGLLGLGWLISVGLRAVLG